MPIVCFCSFSKLKRTMRHKNIMTTQRYAHLTPDNLRKAVKVLDDIDIK